LKATEFRRCLQPWLNDPCAGELSFNLDRQHAAVLRFKRPRLLGLQKPQRKEIMNWKKFFFAFIAAYIFIFLWGWLLNGVFLKDVYAQTPNLWRSQSEMMSLFHWIIIGQALIVFAFVMIYASGFAGGGVMAGIRLGVLLEIAAIGMRLGFYAVQPFPGKLIIYGTASGVIEMIIVGAIVGAIYKPAGARAV
jgi:magnesium-transporting ATPase (P-type)